MDGRCRSERYQVAGFLEFFVVGAESDRQTERGGFERVVDAYAESAADITPFGIAVGRGENTYRIENEQLFAIERCFGGALRIADSSSEGFSEQAVDAAFVHFVRCHDEFDRGVIVYQADQKIFVRSPGRAGDQQTGAAFEPFDEVDFFRRSRNFGNPVEAGVTGDYDVVEAQFCQ